MGARQIVLHEIQHLKHNDTLRNLITFPGNQRATTLFHNYRIFSEKRADILASLTSLEHAQAAAKKYHLNPLARLELKLFVPPRKHYPDYFTQAHYTAKVYEEMLTCVEQNKNTNQNEQIN